MVTLVLTLAQVLRKVLVMVPGWWPLLVGNGHQRIRHPLETEGRSYGLGGSQATLMRGGTGGRGGRGRDAGTQLVGGSETIQRGLLRRFRPWRTGIPLLDKIRRIGRQ